MTVILAQLIKSWTPRLFGLVLVPLLCSTSVAEAAPEHGKNYKDWKISCEEYKDPKGAKKRQCHMFQAIDLKNDKLDISLESPKEGSLRLLTFQIAYNKAKPEHPIAIMTTPLGTSLRPGLSLKIDDGKELKLPFERCLNVGCRVGFLLDGTLVSEMRKGKKGQIVFYDMRGKGISLPVSLSGFTAALRSLKE